MGNEHQRARGKHHQASSQAGEHQRGSVRVSARVEGTSADEQGHQQASRKASAHRKGHQQSRRERHERFTGRPVSENSADAIEGAVSIFVFLLRDPRCSCWMMAVLGSHRCPCCAILVFVLRRLYSGSQRHCSCHDFTCCIRTRRVPHCSG